MIVDGASNKDDPGDHQLEGTGKCIPEHCICGNTCEVDPACREKVLHQLHLRSEYQLSRLVVSYLVEH